MCMATVIYYEGASAKTPEPFDGLKKIGYVVEARKEDNKPKWGGDTVCGVAFKNAHGTYQFSGMAHVRSGKSPHGWRWEIAVLAAKDVLAGWHPGGEWDRIRYYMFPMYSVSKNVCNFKKEFAYIGTVGVHEFYAEPTPEELESLNRKEPEPPECKVKLEPKKSHVHHHKVKRRHHRDRY